MMDLPRSTVVIAYVFTIITLNQLLSLPLPFAASAGGTDEDPFITGDAEKAIAGGRTYDYIIVGGGAAGCPLAATLSQNFSVLLLERGDVARGLDTVEDEIPFLNPLKNTDVFYDGAQRFMTEDGVPGARGKVLGGSTVVNAGLLGRADKEAVQAMGWDEKLLNESYAWVEAKVSFRLKLSQWQAGFLGALLSEGVSPHNGYTVDHVQGTRISASTFDNDGRRHSAAELLSYANPENIVVLLNHTANRVVFNLSSGNPRAVGVEFANANLTKFHNVSLKENGEVILSAGAIGSPQILLLSGIGPFDQLENHSIPVVAVLPGVGQQIADNPRSDVFMLSRLPLDFSSVLVVGIPGQPDVYMEAASLQDDVIGDDNTTTDAYVGWLMIKVGHPRSRGQLWLRSRDPRDNVSVRYNYYSDAHDLDACIQGARIMHRLNQTDILQAFPYENASAIPSHLLPEFAKFGPPFPSNTSDHEAMKRFCKQSLSTIWHYHGGCNTESVVDKKDYHVIGVDALRVVDASIFNETPGTNPQATYMMVGRYKGEQIRRERLSKALNVD